MPALVGVSKAERKYSAAVCPHFSNLEVRSGLDVASLPSPIKPPTRTQRLVPQYGSESSVCKVVKVREGEGMDQESASVYGTGDHSSVKRCRQA